MSLILVSYQRILKFLSTRIFYLKLYQRKKILIL